MPREAQKLGLFALHRFLQRVALGCRPGANPIYTVLVCKFTR